MLRLRQTVFCAVLVAAGFINANAMTDEEKTKISNAFSAHISSCSKEHGISEEEIRATGKTNTMDACAGMCLLTKIRIIDGNGKWDVNRAYELNQAFFGSVAKDITKEQLMNKCASIKDTVFGDGDCNMSLTIFECSMPFQDRLYAFN